MLILNQPIHVVKDRKTIWCNFQKVILRVLGVSVAMNYSGEMKRKTHNDNSLPTKYAEWHEVQKIEKVLSVLFRVFREATIDDYSRFRISGISQ